MLFALFRMNKNEPKGTYKKKTIFFLFFTKYSR